MRKAAAGLAFAAAVAASCALAVNGGRSAVLGGAALIALAGAPTAWRLRHDRLDAPGLYALSSIFLFGAVSLAWLGDPLDPAPAIDRGDVGNACVVVAFGLAAFGIGARAISGPARRPRELAPPGGEARPDRRLLLALFCGSVLLSVIGIALGSYGYAAAIATDSPAKATFGFALIATVGVLVVLTLALIHFRAPEAGLGRLLAITILAEVALGFAGGFKGQSVGPLLLVGVAYVAAGRTIPWRAVTLVLLATLFLLLPANTAYRAIISHRDEGIAGTVLRATYHSMRPDRSVEEAAHYVTTRFRHIDAVAVVQTQTPSVYPRGNGERYALLPLIIVVPRALWDEKPALDDGIQFSHTYWQIPSDRVTASPITEIGDLHRNFGIAGVGIGMFVWGAAIGLFTLLYRRRRSLRLELIYLYMLVYWIAFAAPEQDLPTLLATSIKTLALVVAFAWFVLPGRSGQPGYRALTSRLT